MLFIPRKAEHFIGIKHRKKYAHYKNIKACHLLSQPVRQVVYFLFHHPLFHPSLFSFYNSKKAGVIKSFILYTPAFLSVRLLHLTAYFTLIFTVAFFLLPSFAVAVILTVPFFLAETLPLELTVAIFLLEVFQVTF